MQKSDRFFQIFILVLTFVDTVAMSILLFYSTIYSEQVLGLSLYRHIILFPCATTISMILSGFILTHWVDKTRRFALFFTLCFLSYTLLFLSLSWFRQWHICLFLTAILSFGFTSFHAVMQSFVSQKPELNLEFTHILSASSLGWGIGGVLGGWIFDKQGIIYFSHVYIAVALLSAVFAGLIFLLASHFKLTSIDVKESAPEEEEREVTSKLQSPVEDQSDQSNIKSPLWEGEKQTLWMLCLLITGLTFARATLESLFPNFYIKIAEGTSTGQGIALFGATILGAILSAKLKIKGDGVSHYLFGISLYMLFFLIIGALPDTALVFTLYLLPFYVFVHLGSSEMMKLKSSPENRSRAMGLRQNGEAFGALLGQGFGGVMADMIGLAYLPFLSAFLIFLFLIPGKIILGRIFNEPSDPSKVFAERAENVCP